VDWYDVTGKYHELTLAHECRLSSLPADWQRELAALWRLEADLNNGAYLQFLQNWGKESYVYASQALKKIGAHKMAKIVDRCQALIDEHFNFEKRPPDDQKQLMPNPVIDCAGTVIKQRGSVLPDDVVESINNLSYEFMEYPEDLAALGVRYYRRHIQGHNRSG
jgi:hypothetical protein